MSPNKLDKPLRGIIPPLVTPLAGRNAIDEPGAIRLIEHVIGGGVSGVFALGTTGEAPSLSHLLRHQWVEMVCELVAGRVPVLVGITDTSFVESLELAQRAYEAGAAAVLAAPPFYFPADQQEVVAYFEALAGELPLPLLLYNMPGCTKIEIAPETVLQLSRVDNIIGVKDSSGDIENFRAICRLLADRSDFTRLVGPERLLVDAVAAGGHGGINGGANFWPDLFVNLYDAATSGETDRIEALQRIVAEISETIYEVSQKSTRVIQSIKASLALMGICSDRMAEPFAGLTAEQRERVAKSIHDFADVGLPVVQGTSH